MRAAAQGSSQEQSQRREEVGPLLWAIDHGTRWPKDKPAARFARRGWSLFRAGRYEDAIAAFDQAIDADPTHAWTHAARATAWFGLRRFEEAIAACDRAIEAEPNFGGAHAIRGSALFQLRRFEETIAACDRAIELEPNFGSPYDDRGTALSQVGRFEEAIADLTRAIELQPDKSRAYAKLGIALSEAGQFEDALAAFDRAIAIIPPKLESTQEYAVLHGFRGTALYNLQRYDEAIAAFEREFQLKPDIDPAGQGIWGAALFASAVPSLRVAQWAIERIEQAIVIFDRAIALSPNDPHLTLKKMRLNAIEVLNAFRKEETEPPHYGTVLQLDESKLSGYSGPHGELMGDTTAEYYAAADVARNKGLSSVELKDAIEQKLAEKAAARETTGRATAQPRPEKLTREKIREVKDKARLDGLRVLYGVRLEAATELPEGGFKTKAEADAAALLATTLRDLQKLERKLRLPVTETPERVREGEAMASAYRRSHDKNTGEVIPPRPRGRPRRRAPFQPGSSPP
jgi:tetratricopeptide (TPR) repeat protein